MPRRDPSRGPGSWRLPLLAVLLVVSLTATTIYFWSQNDRPPLCPALSAPWSSEDHGGHLEEALPDPLKFSKIRDLAGNGNGNLNGTEFRCLQINKYGLFATVMQIFAVHTWNNFKYEKRTCISGITPYFKNGNANLSFDALFPNLITSEEIKGQPKIAAEFGIHDCNNLFQLTNDLVYPLGAFRLYKQYLQDLESELSSEYLSISDKIDSELKRLGLGKDYVAAHIRRGDSIKAKMRGNSIRFSIGDWARRIKVGVRLMNPSSILIMSDDLNFEAEICANLSAIFPDKNCIEVTRHFLSTPDARVASEYLGLPDEGFRLWKFAKVFAASRLMVGTFSSNFERVAQLWRDDPFEKMYDVNGWHWQPCWHGANPLNEGRPILETVPAWTDP